MVTNVTSLGRNGLYDWLVQRISAVVLLVWFVYVGCYAALHEPLTYVQWQGLFTQTWMRIFTLIALLSLCARLDRTLDHRNRLLLRALDGQEGDSAALAGTGCLPGGAGSLSALVYPHTLEYLSLG